MRVFKFEEVSGLYLLKLLNKVEINIEGIDDPTLQR